MPLEGHGCESQPEQDPTSPQRDEVHSNNTIHNPGPLTETSPAPQAVHHELPMFDSADLTMSTANPADLLGGSPQSGISPGGAHTTLDPFMFDSLSWPWHHETSYLVEPEPLNLASQAPTALQQHQSYQSEHGYGGANAGEAAEVSGDTDQTSSAPASQSYPDTSIEQAQVLDEIMAYALSVKADTSNRSEHSAFWYAASSKVAKAFNIYESPQSDGKPLLEHFVDLFFRYFEPLWPLFSLQNLVINNLHPLLYLVLTSIGAMYGDNKAMSFGSKMHARVQACLVEPLELRDPSYDSPWLAQTRCHSRVAALYFGQSRAISHAHHLGTLLAAQARRMELFSAAYSKTSMEKFRNLDGSLTDQERLTIWLRCESRRRLAFGIYRSEAYTSLLLQSKPLFYLGEIDLTFPSCDAVWNGEKMPASVCIHLIENDRTPGRDLYASEIYYIALDSDETLPPLDPISYELLALGLLWPAWEYSRNPTLLSRLCGEKLSVPDELSVGGFSESSATISGSPPSMHSDASRRPCDIRDYDHLDRTSRKMVDLHSGYRRLLLALSKWEQSLPIVKLFARS